MSNLSGYYLHNFKTSKPDHLTETPSDWSDYIPQDVAAQNLYQLHIKMGKSPAVAAGHTLAAYAGVEFKEPAP